MTYQQYLDRLTELSMSMFEWKNLPDTVDWRFMERNLLFNGCAIFFNDEAVGYLVEQSRQTATTDNSISRTALLSITILSTPTLSTIL